LVREDLHTTLCSFQGASGSRHKTYMFAAGSENPAAFKLKVQTGACVGAAPPCLVTLLLKLQVARHQDRGPRYEADEGSVPGDLAYPQSREAKASKGPRDHHEDRDQQ